MNNCREPAIIFLTRRKKCLHNLTPLDIPPGVDLDDLILPCAKDSSCPQNTPQTK